MFSVKTLLRSVEHVVHIRGLTKESGIPMHKRCAGDQWIENLMQ